LRRKEKKDRILAEEGLSLLCHSTIIWHKKEVHPFDYKIEEEVLNKKGILFKRRTSTSQYLFITFVLLSDMDFGDGT
jgi:hypothetical protein